MFEPKAVTVVLLHSLFCLFRGEGTVKKGNEPVVLAFEKYYECLDRVNEKVKKNNNWVEARLVQSGQSVTLSCGLCLRPDQDVADYHINWYRTLQTMLSEGLVPIEERRFMISPSKSLTINYVTVEDAGLYSCLKGNIYWNTYQLDVSAKEKRRIVRLSGRFKRPQNNTILPELNLLLSTTWTLWSDCNQCNRLAYRRRIGICTVKKIHADRPVLPRDMPRLNNFPDGVPCRSTALPEFIADIPAILNRASETMIGECFIPCPTTPAYTNITDRYGRVVEHIKSGQGIYSMNKPKPQLPALVKRKVIYEERGKRLILECPEASVETKLIHWQNGTRIINAALVRRRTRGRIFIDAQNRLVVRKLRMTDSQAYSCWISGRHVATFKVVVTEEIVRGKDVPKHIILIGLGLALLTILCIGKHAFKARNQKTAR